MLPGDEEDSERVVVREFDFFHVDIPMWLSLGPITFCFKPKAPTWGPASRIRKVRQDPESKE